MNNFYNTLFQKTYGVKIEETTFQQDADIRNAMTQLRGSYRNNVTPTLYDQDEIRKAYMIGYFPHSVHVTEEVMSKYVLPFLPNKDKVTFSFFAGGPCPEFLGALYAIAHSPFHNSLEAVTYDCEENWVEQIQAGFSMKDYIAPNTNGTLRYFYGCDLCGSCSECECRDKWCSQQLAKTDVIFVQNLLSHISNVYEVTDKLQKLLNMASPSTLLVMVDYNYAQTRLALTTLSRTATIDCLSSNVQESCNRTRTPLTMPKAFQEKIFIGGDGLGARFYTNYYYGVFRKAA